VTDKMKSASSDKPNNQKEGKEDNFLTEALSDLNYCLDILKIKKDTEIHGKTNELFIQNFTAEAIHIYGERIVALKTIADLCVSSNIIHIFSQSELYDFLTLATEGTPAQKRPRISDIVFKIYRDIMENYQTSEYSIKINYPRIIVDVFAIIHTGADSSGRRVGVYAINEYYMSRKSKPSESMLAATAVQIRPTATIQGEAATPADNLQKNRIQEHLVQTLMQITGRRSKELRESLAELNDSDIKKIGSLCINHTKIEKYCKLIANPKDFRNEVQKEIGRKLTDNQVQIAAI